MVVSGRGGGAIPLFDVPSILQHCFDFPIAYSGLAIIVGSQAMEQIERDE